MKARIITLAVMLMGTGCSLTPSWSKPAEDPGVIRIIENPIPGTVNREWAEPMVDQVRVPGQLDPEGNYYRPSHDAIVEIRPKRYQQVEFPPDENTR